MPCGGPGNTINVYKVGGAAGTISTTESIAGSTQEPTMPTTEDVVTFSPTVPTTEDVVTYSSATMPEVRYKEHPFQVQFYHII